MVTTTQTTKVIPNNLSQINSRHRGDFVFSTQFSRYSPFQGENQRFSEVLIWLVYDRYLQNYEENRKKPRWREQCWDKHLASTSVVSVILPIQAVGRGASDFAAPLTILSLRLYCFTCHNQKHDQAKEKKDSFCFYNIHFSTVRQADRERLN